MEFLIYFHFYQSSHKYANMQMIISYKSSLMDLSPKSFGSRTLQILICKLLYTNHYLKKIYVKEYGVGLPMQWEDLITKKRIKFEHRNSRRKWRPPNIWRKSTKKELFIKQLSFSTAGKTFFYFQVLQTVAYVLRNIKYRQCLSPWSRR